ncbi:DNA-binding transcriptional regulator, XRE-family HTH domain [Amphritea atlantica]|uniref:DNA-binding transcriptional regulator, XRE-family HTH domain n=1 Tax=Amphritea atlantica TaxID=355243 RepID=A0A1H9GEJ1_9GAMM|nr:helix-turn-helix transcriptional regulator [Amphritea atlantica]SEQ48506.1 DNA-binding transcriptional regulator, XRE-family HTH domain [Amphritea atlantica]
MTAEQFKKARLVLGYDQKQMGAALGWAGDRQVSKLETGKGNITVQTALAVECLLRRVGDDVGWLSDEVDL